MLLDIRSWIAAALTPRNSAKAAVRIELLRAVAHSNLQIAALPVIAVPLVALDLQWVPIWRILPWLGAVCAAAVWMILASRRLLKSRFIPAEAGALSLRMILVWLPLMVIWPMMAISVWIPADSFNQAFITVFLLASMALAMLQIGYSRQLSAALLAIYVPLLTFYHVHDRPSFALLGLVLMIVWGMLAFRLSARFEQSFVDLALKSIEKEALASELATTASELARARDEAQEVSQLKSKFLANMSHELRTPLNAIIGFSDIIRTQMFGSIEPPKYAEYAEDIHRSGQHLLQLINTLLDLSKIEAGKLELQEREVDLEAIVAHTLRFVELQARRGGVSLSHNIEPGFALFADERTLIQVLTNLVSNAVKFTPPGGDVTVFSHIVDGKVAIGVQDTGAGMKPEDVERALEPFVQIAHHATVEGWGVGLGLPLVKAVVELHGGTFHLETHQGVGTTAWAEFPAGRTIRCVAERTARTGT